MTGLIYIVIAQFLWATEFVLIRKFFAHHNTFFVMAAASLIGSLFYLPTLFVVKQKVTLPEMALLVLYGVTSWYLAQVSYAKGIQIANSTFAAALVTLMMPMFALLLSFIFLKEALTIKIVVGGIFMIIGFILLSA